MKTHTILFDTNNDLHAWLEENLPEHYRLGNLLFAGGLTAMLGFNYLTFYIKD